MCLLEMSWLYLQWPIFLSHFRKTLTSWWPTCEALSLTSSAASSRTRPRPPVTQPHTQQGSESCGQSSCFRPFPVQGSWTRSWCSTSCAATVCWRASGSAGRASPTASSTLSSNSGKMRPYLRSWKLVKGLDGLLTSHYWISNISLDHSAIVSWTLLPSLMTSSWTAEKLLRSCWLH